MGLLTGKAGIITGGGTGIGYGIARTFLSEGALVVICGRRKDVLEQAVEQLKEKGPPGCTSAVSHAVCDVTRQEDIIRCVEQASRITGSIDFLINSAGVMRFGRMAEASLDDWETQIKVNLYGPWRMSVEVLPYMRRRHKGSIVTISSISGLRPNPGSGIYCTSKAGLQMMSQVMALEEAENGIRINCICPGVVEDTELGFPMFGEQGSKEFYPRLRSLHPLGRNGKPGDIAAACLFLVSDTSGFITGVLLPVDGGRHMMMNTMEEHNTSGKEK